jgi:hypothetical protein
MAASLLGYTASDGETTLNMPGTFPLFHLPLLLSLVVCSRLQLFVLSSGSTSILPFFSILLGIPLTTHIYRTCINQALIDTADLLGLWPRLRPVPSNCITLGLLPK